MGRAGPPPKPVELRALEGGKENLDAPQPVHVRSPEPPFELTAEARAIWDEMSEKLERTGVLTEVDLFLIARYCTHRAEWIRLQAYCQEHGDFVKQISNRGHEYQSKRAEATRRDNLEAQILRIEKECGLTPASRGTMHVMAVNPSKRRSDFAKKLYRR